MEEKRDDKSIFDLLRGRLSFTKESFPQRVIITVLTMMFLLSIIYILKGYVFGVLFSYITDISWVRRK
jgi:hypothetical protein